MAVKTKVKAKAKGKIGRPATGKRSNAEYRQTSLWLRRDTLDDTLKALIVNGQRIQLSFIVQHLLDEWLDAGAKLPKAS